MYYAYIGFSGITSFDIVTRNFLFFNTSLIRKNRYLQSETTNVTMNAVIYFDFMIQRIGIKYRLALNLFVWHLFEKKKKYRFQICRVLSEKYLLCAPPRVIYFIYFFFFQRKSFQTNHIVRICGVQLILTTHHNATNNGYLLVPTTYSKNKKKINK